MNIYRTEFRFTILVGGTWTASPAYETQEKCDAAMLRCMQWARSNGQNSVQVRTWSKTWCVGKTDDTEVPEAAEVAPF